jgi:hypothetical protein
MEYPEPMVTISLSEYLSLKDNINTENVTDEDYLELFNLVGSYYNQHVAFENGTTRIIPENTNIFLKKIQNKFYIKKNKK